MFVNPALTEPFGLTLIEAAASGLPVVATNDGGPQDILRLCGNGVLVDPLDADEMAASDRGGADGSAAVAQDVSVGGPRTPTSTSPGAVTSSATSEPVRSADRRRRARRGGVADSGTV